MTPEAVAQFRAFLDLRDIAADDNPLSVFDAMARIAAWAYRQKEAPSPGLDAMLDPLRESTSLWMGVLLHLATLDQHFFHLARRMAARTLIRTEPPSLLYRQMSAALLVSDPPATVRPKQASHVATIIGVAVVQQLVWNPTETEHKAKPMGDSGCGKMAMALESLGVTQTYFAIEKAWKARFDTLVLAGFSEAAASDFFRFVSPMR